MLNNSASAAMTASNRRLANLVFRSGRSFKVQSVMSSGNGWIVGTWLVQRLVARRGRIRHYHI
jgi:hypothetical protein